MHILENENVRVELSEDAAVLRLTDKKNGVLMESDSPFQFIYGGFYTFDRFNRRSFRFLCLLVAFQGTLLCEAGKRTGCPFHVSYHIGKRYRPLSDGIH